MGDIIPAQEFNSSPLREPGNGSQFGDTAALVRAKGRMLPAGLPRRLAVARHRHCWRAVTRG